MYVKYIYLCFTTECNANMVKMKVHQVQIVAAAAKLLLFFVWKQFSM